MSQGAKKIKAIPTFYAGCVFRSRLEARWAVFFDALEIKWEYEQEGYDAEHGYYLPDFLLSGLHGEDCAQGRLWFEVKPERDGEATTTTTEERWRDLVEMTERPLIVAFGMPRPDLADLTFGTGAYYHASGYMEIFASWGWDFGRAFTVCPCGKVGIAYRGRSERVCDHGARRYDDDHPRVVGAYNRARSAQFEYGRSG